MARERSQEPSSSSAPFRPSQPGPSRSGNLFRISASPSDNRTAASTQPTPSTSRHQRTVSNNSQADEDAERKARRQKRIEEQAYQVKGWENLSGGGGSKPVFAYASSKQYAQTDSSKNASSSTSTSEASKAQGASMDRIHRSASSRSRSTTPSAPSFASSNAPVSEQTSGSRPSSVSLGKRKTPSPSPQPGLRKSAAIVSTQIQATIDEEPDSDFEVVGFKPFDKRSRVDPGVKASPSLDEPPNSLHLRRSSSRPPSTAPQPVEKSRSPFPADIQRPSPPSASSSRAPSLSRSVRARSTSSNHASSELTPQEVKALMQSAIQKFTDGTSLADQTRKVVQDYLDNVDASHPEYNAVQELETKLGDLGTKPGIAEIRTVTESHSVPRGLAQRLAKVFRAWHTFLLLNHRPQESTSANVTAPGPAMAQAVVMNPVPAALTGAEAVDELADEPRAPSAEVAEKAPALEEIIAGSAAPPSTIETTAKETTAPLEEPCTQDVGSNRAMDVVHPKGTGADGVVQSVIEKSNAANQADKAVSVASPDTTGSPQAFDTPPEELGEEMAGKQAGEDTDHPASAGPQEETDEQMISSEQVVSEKPTIVEEDATTMEQADVSERDATSEQVGDGVKSNMGEQPDGMASASEVHQDQPHVDERDKSEELANKDPQPDDVAMEATETPSETRAQPPVDTSTATTRSPNAACSLAESTLLHAAPQESNQALGSDDLLMPAASTDDEMVRPLTPGAEFSGTTEFRPCEHDSTRSAQEGAAYTTATQGSTSVVPQQAATEREGHDDAAIQGMNENCTNNSVDALMKAHTVPLSEAAVETTPKQTSSATAADIRGDSAPARLDEPEAESGHDRASRSVSQAASDTLTTGKAKKTINDRMKVMLRDLAGVTGRGSSYRTIQELKPLRAGLSTPRTVTDLVENWQDPAKMIPWICLQELGPDIFHKKARQYMDLPMEELMDRVSSTRSVQHLMKVPERVLTRAVMEFPRVPHMLHCWDEERKKFFSSRWLPEPTDTRPEFRFADEDPSRGEGPEPSVATAQVATTMPTSALATTQPRSTETQQHPAVSAPGLVHSQNANMVAPQQLLMDPGVQALASQILRNPSLFPAGEPGVSLLPHIGAQLAQQYHAAVSVPSVPPQQQMAYQQRTVYPHHPALPKVQTQMHQRQQLDDQRQYPFALQVQEPVRRTGEQIRAEAEKTFGSFVSDPLSLAEDVLSKSGVNDEVSQRGFTAAEVMHVITFALNEHRADVEAARRAGRVDTSAEARYAKMTRVQALTIAVLRLTSVLKTVREALRQSAEDEIRRGVKTGWEKVLVSTAKWEKDVRELLEGELASWPLLARGDQELLLKRKVLKVSRTLEEVLGRISEMGVAVGPGDDEVKMVARICCKHVIGELGGRTKLK